MAVRVTIAVMALAVLWALFLADAFAGASKEEALLLFVPKKGDHVSVEIVIPNKRMRDGRAKMLVLKRLLEKNYRLTRDGDDAGQRGKCFVSPRQLEFGDAVLELYCQSLEERDGAPYALTDQPSTPQGVMTVIKEFLREQSRLYWQRQTPPPGR